MRDSVEGPAELAGANVVGANVAGRCGKRFGVATADDDQIFVDDTGTSEGNPRIRERAAETFAQVDATLLTEGGEGFASGGVEREEEVHDADEDALVGFGVLAGTVLVGTVCACVGRVGAGVRVGVGIGARPESQTAVRLRTRDSGVESPDRFAGGGIEGEDLLRGRDPVEDAFNDDGARLKATGFLGVVGPGYGEVGDVGSIDLRQWRVVHVARRAAVDRPRLVLHGCVCGNVALRRRR